MRKKKKQKENIYQEELKKRLKEEFPECIVMKSNPNDIQGIPDITMLCPNRFWVLLEAKREQNRPHQPNQDYYIEKAKKDSFGSFIYPENEEEVINEIKQAYGA